MKTKNNKRLLTTFVVLMAIGGGAYAGVNQYDSNKVWQDTFVGNDSDPLELPDESALEKFLEMMRVKSTKGAA